MKKIIMMFVLMMTSMGAYANTNMGNIITPDIAISMWSTSYFIYDKEMNILVCPRNADFKFGLTANSPPTCLDKNEKNAWTTMVNAIPKGKKFVGFNVTVTDRREYITIYWK